MHSDIRSLQQEVSQLRETGVNRVCRVTGLTSLLAASKHDTAPHLQSIQPNSTLLATPPQASVTSLPATYATAAASNANAEVSHRRHRSPASNQRHDDAVTAMYVDQQRKQQRANNIIFSRLPQTDNEAKTVTELLRSEFEWNLPDWPGVSVTSCRRIGHHQENKVQPLLVTLHNSHQSEYYIRNAKVLRDSRDEVVRSSVFINPDLTPSEARAAYELRLQRRQRRERREHHSTEHNNNSTNSRIFYPSNNRFSSSVSYPVASSHISDLITPELNTHQVNIQPKLVWSARQSLVTASVSAGARDGDAFATSTSIPAAATIFTSPTTLDSVVAVTLGDSSSTNSAGSCA